VEGKFGAKNLARKLFLNQQKTKTARTKRTKRSKRSKGAKGPKKNVRPNVEDEDPWARNLGGGQREPRG